MRIQLNDRRERRYNDLLEASGESAKSKALDVAADYYIRARGNTTAVPEGFIQQLMSEAEKRGSLTPQEIAAIVDCDELPVRYEVSRSIGRE